MLFLSPNQVHSCRTEFTHYPRAGWLSLLAPDGARQRGEVTQNVNKKAPYLMLTEAQLGAERQPQPPGPCVGFCPTQSTSVSVSGPAGRGKILQLVTVQAFCPPLKISRSSSPLPPSQGRGGVTGGRPSSLYYSRVGLFFLSMSLSSFIFCVALGIKIFLMRSLVLKWLNYICNFAIFLRFLMIYTIYCCWTNLDHPK